MQWERHVFTRLRNVRTRTIHEQRARFARVHCTDNPFIFISDVQQVRLKKLGYTVRILERALHPKKV